MSSWFYKKADKVFRYGRRQYLSFDRRYYIAEAEVLLGKLEENLPSWSDIRKSYIVQLLTGERSHALRILGLEKTATDDDILTAYRGLVKKCHPDVCPQDQEAISKFQSIKTAKDTLL